MSTHQAHAYPRKHFFFEMFTRDISFEDCVLDLIDNSIDGLIRTHKVDISGTILSLKNPPAPRGQRVLPRIDVTYSENEFCIQDTCGGITREHALKEVFNFGHAEGHSGGALGVYGIGLKRAIFKIGQHFKMESRTQLEGFSVDLNVKEWAEKDDQWKDWTIPLTFVGGAESCAKAGTVITMSVLRPEVVMRINDGTLEHKLHSAISQTYGLFLDRYVDIRLNKHPVKPFEIPIGNSAGVQAAHEIFTDGDVTVDLFASIAAQDANGQWPSEPAGWYVLCNGRVVVAADKTDLTAWEAGSQWHSGKHRGFIGIASFQSAKALALPWTTTKRGLNRESAVYQKARNRMRGVAKPILTFLDGMWKPDATQEGAAQTIANEVKPVSLRSLAASPPSSFNISYAGPRAARTKVSVQFSAEKTDIEKVKKNLRRPGLSAGHVGKLTFEHYVKTECPE